MPIEALQQAIAARQPTPGLVHHSDRGIQYASAAYVAVLEQHQRIPSMSRPANPYDNASCESVIKTLKREEIDANRYRDLGHLRRHIEGFLEQYDNRLRLHSALGYRPPEEFEHALASHHPSDAATLQWFRPAEGGYQRSGRMSLAPYQPNAEVIRHVNCGEQPIAPEIGPQPRAPVPRE